MNIFEHRDGIIGNAYVEDMARELRALFELAREIRTKLGSRAYLLDRYLAYLLAAAHDTLCSDAANQGFVSGGALRHICRTALCGEDGNHPMFAKARAYLAAHPLPFQEPRTNTAILMVAMMGEYMKTDTVTFLEDQDHRLLGSVDMTHVQQLYQQIAGLLGGELMMEQLNLFIQQRFFAVPVMAAYVQGLTNDLAYALTHRDPETSKQVFQLILDHGLPMGEARDDLAEGSR